MRHQPITDQDARLQVHMSWWGMTNLNYEGKPLSMEEKFRMIAESGFDGIDAFVPESGETERWRSLLDQYGLQLSVNLYPTSLVSMQAAMERVAQYGDICSVNVQVLTPFLTGAGAEELLQGIAGLAKVYGIPVNVETHRGTITQDLIRTAEYVERVPDLRLTADLSHYVLAGEMLQIPAEAARLFTLLLERTDCIHGRISNGEQIQVDIGAEGAHPMFPQYSKWWEEAMCSWRRSHPQGGTFLFIPELGPPSYAITTDEITGRSHEFSDRWAQSLFLKDHVRMLWARTNEKMHSSIE